MYDFFLEKVKSEVKPDDAWDKKRLAEEVIPFITGIQNPIVHTHYVKKLAEVLGVTTDTIESMAKKKAVASTATRAAFVKDEPVEKQKREEVLQKMILSRLFQSENPYGTADDIFPILAPEDFSIPSYAKLVNSFLQYRHEAPQFEPNAFSRSLPAELSSVCDELYLYTGPDLLQEDLLRMALELKKIALREQITRLIAAGSEIAQQELAGLTGRLKEVEKRLVS